MPLKINIVHSKCGTAFSYRYRYRHAQVARETLSLSHCVRGQQGMVRGDSERRYGVENTEEDFR